MHACYFLNYAVLMNLSFNMLACNNNNNNYNERDFRHDPRLKKRVKLLHFFADNIINPSIARKLPLIITIVEKNKASERAFLFRSQWIH
jgi:hypothetical protein